MKIKSIKYIKYPVILICLTICISGARWLLSSEPWMLDQLANEERLKMSFTELFLIERISKLTSADFSVTSWPSNGLLVSFSICTKLVFGEAKRLSDFP